MIYDNIDVSLKDEIHKIFKEEKEDKVAAITMSVVEDYALHVGYLQALRVLEDKINRVFNAYFPT